MNRNKEDKISHGAVMFDGWNLIRSVGIRQIFKDKLNLEPFKFGDTIDKC